MKAKCVPALFGLAALALAGSASAERDMDETYKKTCGVCHAAGVANAPKTGDAATWKERLDTKGMDALVASVKNGLNAMPPKGMCMDCTDEEYAALITLMAGQ